MRKIVGWINANPIYRPWCAEYMMYEFHITPWIDYDLPGWDWTKPRIYNWKVDGV